MKWPASEYARSKSRHTRIDPGKFLVRHTCAYVYIRAGFMRTAPLTPLCLRLHFWHPQSHAGCRQWRLASVASCRNTKEEIVTIRGEAMEDQK